jgi:hypothetical protein
MLISYDTGLIREQSRHVVLPLVVAIVGTIAMLLGLIIDQSGLPYSLFNTLGTSWYLLFVSIALICGVCGSIATEMFGRSRLAICAFCAVYVSMTPGTIAQAVLLAQADDGILFKAGGFFLVFGTVVSTLAYGYLIMTLGIENNPLMEKKSSETLEMSSEISQVTLPGIVIVPPNSSNA